MDETLQVNLGARSYDIVIGDGVLERAGAYVRKAIPSRRVAIISDKTVGALYLERLKASLAAQNIACSSLVLEAGERTKSWDNLAHILDWLFSENYARDGAILALGGGVIGDLAGFAAAIFRRGVAYIQLPTSLLAQVDSAVGGKTGINVAYGKNLVGAFYQPKLVLSDTGLLKSLSERDFLSGYGEVVKYGLLADYAFFEWCEANSAAILARESGALARIVKRSCEIKAQIVAEDEHDLGKRAFLNLGHTFGHALETATGYSVRLLHGEAVAIGCVLAAELSAHLGVGSQEMAGRVSAHLAAMGMKGALAQIDGDLPDADGLMALMRQDKKVRDGQIHFVLLSEIGKAMSYAGVDDAFLRGFLREQLANAQ